MANRRLEKPGATAATSGAEAARPPPGDPTRGRGPSPDAALSRAVASRGPLPNDLVTVVIPAHNAARTLGATLASARAQTHRAIEIVVVDDGSTDATAEVAAEAASADRRVRLILQSNGGVAAARNAGLAAARGDWIAPLDADDLWRPEKIERQLAAARLAKAPLAFVYCWSRRIDERGAVLADLGAPMQCGDVFRELLVSNFVRNASCPLIPADRLRAVGGYDASLRSAGAQGAEDLKLYLALAAAGRVEVVPAFLVGYRVSSGSMSRSADTMRQSIALAIAAAVEGRSGLEDALRVARVNYDLYAADVALGARHTGGFLRHLLAAGRGDPALAAGLLKAAALDRLDHSRSRDRGRDFLSLDPERRLVPGRAVSRVDWLLERALQRRSLRDGCDRPPSD